MNDERVRHQCHKEGCDSEATMTTRLVLLCVAPGEKQEVRMHCSIKVCPRHAVSGEVRSYLLSDQNREAIRTSLMENGYHEPDFLTAKVLFDPIKFDAVHVLARPPAMCDREGCKKQARWQIEQRFRMLWQRGKSVPLVKVLTNLCVCDEHKELTRPSDFMDKESKSRTLGWLVRQGVSMPDMRTMEIGFVGLDNGQRIEPRLYVGNEGPKAQFDIPKA